MSEGTYSKFKRRFIDFVKKETKTRDEIMISSIFDTRQNTSPTSFRIFLEGSYGLYEEKLHDLLLYFPNDYYRDYKERIISDAMRIEDNNVSELQHCLVLYATVVFFAKKLTEFNRRFDRREIDKFYLNDSIDYNYYYRGQTQDWPIAPSVLRNLKESLKIDIDGLEHLYRENGLIDKYKEHINDGKPINDKYQLIAFMQHACSYSPFIDFTKKPIIATSFALSNVNSFNIFKTEKAYIYSMYYDKFQVINKNEADSFIKSIDYFCIHIADKFAYGKIYDYDEYANGIVSKNTIVIHTPLELFDLLRPDLVIIDSPTNDRMKYQSGVFAVFYNYVSFEGKLKYSLIPGFSLMSYPIAPSSKRSIVNKIIRDHYGYEYDFLMDPYHIFNK